MKRLTAVLLCICAVLTSCGETETPQAEPTPEATSAPDSQVQTEQEEKETAAPAQTTGSKAGTPPAKTEATASDEIKAPDEDITPPEAVSFRVATSSESTKITWEPVEDADGYAVWIMRSENGEWEYIKNTEELSCTLEEPRNKENSFCVKAYKLDSSGNKVYSEKADVSAFPYMYSENGVTYVDGGLLIVNKTYPLPEDYGSGLTDETLGAFYEMQTAAANDGISLWITSGFRSYTEQAATYQSYVYRDGSSESADTYSARAGHSEHQSGLAFDLNFAGTSFNGTPEAQWIAANCSRFGFIIRYPEGKEDITGYNYESWHCRYVGKELAKILTESGQTLEEFYGLTSKYSE